MEYPNVWAEIDLGAIARNVKALSAASPGADLMAVVKANAYGHGSVAVAKKALEAGATSLGVARFDEALVLREGGITAPILIFGYTHPGLAGELVRLDLTQTVYSLPIASELSRQVSSAGGALKVHVKIDTGMGRLGLVSDALLSRDAALCAEHSALADVLAISKLPGLFLEGIMTHFAGADSKDQTHAKQQISAFQEFLSRLGQPQGRPLVRHAANSAAIIDLPESHLDMVRAGISLYGLPPSAEMRMNGIALAPAMALKSRIAYLKRVPAGFAVSYGSTFVTSAPTTIASIPVGYADGYNRLFSSSGHMLVRGKKAPIVGRVCMDQTLIDVGHIPEAELNDEVVLMGRQGQMQITAEEIAESLSTINYEVVSTVMQRVTRIYRNG